MKEIRSKTIWPWGFLWSHIVYEFLHLSHRNNFNKHLIFFPGHSPRNQVSDPIYSSTLISTIFFEDIRKMLGQLFLYFPLSFRPATIHLFELLDFGAISILDDRVVEKFSIPFPLLDPFNPILMFP